MNLYTEPYLVQSSRWPKAGRHILAQFDESTVVVYQAFRPEIGLEAARLGRFGSGFRLNRMSWIKPNFLWMMYRSGWGSKPDQEITLALRLQRSAFDEILSRAVHSTFLPEIYESEAAWKEGLARSAVRLQWDPDHDPAGTPLPRRAIQLGLRGEVLSKFTGEWVLEIQDISEFVAEQSHRVHERRLKELMTPTENVYSIDDPVVAARLQIDPDETLKPGLP